MKGKRSINSIKDGEQFGRWTVIREAKEYGKPREWLCICECGTTKAVYGSSLLSGKSQSCGCLQKERVTAHGLSESPTWNSWYNMVRRCTDPLFDGYENYGAKGITVCPRWLVFENFLADMGERPPGHTIDRKDNDLGYSAKNCRWATRQQQAVNRRNSRFVTYEGKEYNVSALARLHGIKPTTLHQRLFAYHWPVERAVNTPTN